MPSNPIAPNFGPSPSGSVPWSYHSATWGASSRWANSRTVSRMARSSSVSRSSMFRKSWDIQRPFHSGGRLSLKAAWNSAWSAVVISSAWVIASSSIAAPIGMSSSRVISDLVWA